jgi:hypothetical protein
VQLLLQALRRPKDRVITIGYTAPLATGLPSTTPTPTTTPTTTPKDDPLPLTGPQTDPLPSPAGPGYTPPYSTRTSECDCAPKKKRKPATPRTECFKGSYVEKARGLTKTKREKVPCR